jgi:hypothetical protein
MPDVRTASDLEIRHFTAPPAGFDPLKAAPRELLIYGFPARPDPATSPQQYARWQAVFAKPLRRIEPTFVRRPDHVHGPRRPAPDSAREAHAGVADETSGNWSGSVHYAAAGDSCTYVVGYWTVPDVVVSGSGDQYCATWIGIDGDRSSDVLQVGTEQEIIGGAHHTYVWWEWYPQSEVAITNLAVSPGDVMYCLICVHSPTSAGFYIKNETTGDYVSFNQNAPAGTAVVGNCAEWIVEAPTIGGRQAALADYAEVFFDESTAGTRGGVTLDAGSGTTVTMVDASGNTVSTPTLENATLVKVAFG